MTRSPHARPALTIGVGLYTGQRPAGAADRSLADALVLARAAEEAGFDAFWVSEHHGWEDGYLPAPLTLLAALAAVTERITLATGVVLAPLHHPLALAEQAAVVDQVAGGRLLLGLGAGYLRSEFARVGADPGRRGAAVEETVAILRQAWTGERFSHHGTVWQLDDVRVTPRPHAGRQIPIWLGGYAPAAVARAGRIADGHLVGRGDPEVVRRAVTTLAAATPRRADLTIGVNLLTAYDGAGGSGHAARAAFAAQQAAYEAVQRADDPYGGAIDVGAGGGAALALGTADAYLHLAGDVTAMVEGVRRHRGLLAGWPRVHLVLRALFPESDLDRQVTRLAALGDEVLPALRAAWAD